MTTSSVKIKTSCKTVTLSVTALMFSLLKSGALSSFDMIIA